MLVVEDTENMKIWKQVRGESGHCAGPGTVIMEGVGLGTGSHRRGKRGSEKLLAQWDDHLSSDS